MGGGETVDREFLPAGFGKMKEAADVVVLVVSGEEALGFGRSQAKGGERDRLAKISGVGAVQTMAAQGAAKGRARRSHVKGARQFVEHAVVWVRCCGRFCGDQEERL